MTGQNGVILEDINSKIDAILEIVVPMQQDVIQLKQDMVEVKSDIKIMKAVLKSTNSQLNDHERRITHLEATPA